MKPDMVTCSFVMNRNVYNAFKSVVNKHKQNVKGEHRAVYAERYPI